MINICFIVYDLGVIGGVERVVENLANRFSEKYSVHVVSLHGENVHPAIHFSESIIIKHYNLPKKRVRYQLIESFFKLKEYFEENKIDIAFLESTYVGFIGSPLGKFTRTIVVFCDHGALLNQINDRGITLMRRVAATFCNHIVVLTKKTKNDYKKSFNISESKITYIYNWIKETSIYSGIEYEYNDESKIILTVGRLSEEKGFDLLLDVAKRVLPANPEWEWHIYGEGPLEKQIQKEIKQNNLTESLILKGVSNNMDLVYKKASLCVLTSYREGMPLVLLEAKSYKLPCISFDILTGPNEIIEDKTNGYLVQPYDTDEMAKCINELIKQPKLRINMSKNAYSNIDQFSERTILEKWIDLIDKLYKSV